MRHMRWPVISWASVPVGFDRHPAAGRMGVDQCAVSAACAARSETFNGGVFGVVFVLCFLYTEDPCSHCRRVQLDDCFHSAGLMLSGREDGVEREVFGAPFAQVVNLRSALCPEVALRPSGIKDA